MQRRMKNQIKSQEARSQKILLTCKKKQIEPVQCSIIAKPKKKINQNNNNNNNNKNK